MHVLFLIALGWSFYSVAAPISSNPFRFDPNGQCREWNEEGNWTRFANKKYCGRTSESQSYRWDDDGTCSIYDKQGARISTTLFFYCNLFSSPIAFNTSKLNELHKDKFVIDLDCRVTPDYCKGNTYCGDFGLCSMGKRRSCNDYESLGLCKSSLYFCGAGYCIKNGPLPKPTTPLPVEEIPKTNESNCRAVIIDGQPHWFCG